MNDINSIFKEVIDSSNIYDVVSHYLGAGSIKKQGKGYTCLCPFHNDNNPSMSLDMSRNIFHCWSCNEKGGVLEFVMKYKNLNKMEALKELASISNITLPEDFNSSSKPSVKDKFSEEIKALTDLSKFYQLMLSSKFGNEARSYLNKRKLDEDTIKHFEIGYAPIDSKLSIDALEKNYSIPTLEKAGILSQSKQLEDRMFNRIIFPLKDEFGNIVAFSGRQIEKSDSAKYINYPDTSLFTKGDLLYNYFGAKKDVNQTRYIYLVEGYMDAIAYYRAGIKSVVASMGTALSENQIRLLKNLNTEVRLSFDTDLPGQTNQLKIMNQLLTNNIKVQCVRPFTKYKDSDEVFSNGGAKLLNDLSSKLIDPFLFFLAFTLHGRKELSDTNEINKFINSSKPYFVRLDDVSKVKNLEILSKITKLDNVELKNLYSSKKKETTIIQDNKSQYQFPRRSQNNQNDLILKRIDKIYNPNSIDSIRLDIKSFTENSLFEQFNISEIVYNNEVEIITNCFYSNSAIKIINNEKFIFSFEPFNDLFYLISFIYQSNPDKKSFNQDMFNQLLDSFNSSGENQESEFEGIEISDLSFDKEIKGDNLLYLNKYIELFAAFATSSISEFNDSNFSRSIEKVSKLKKKKFNLKS